MLRIFLLQEWSALFGPQVEGAIFDSTSMWRFARLDSASDGVPNVTAI